MSFSGPIATLLEMAAVNNGFDRERPRFEGWLGFASTHAPLELWLQPRGAVGSLVALSQLNVAKALEGYGDLVEVPMPTGARAARAVADHPRLYALLRRAFQLSKTLPDELLHVFEEKVAGLPRATEIERLVVQRVGQDVFRAGLLEYWDGRCAITGLAVPELLRASHIKPWADCNTDAERLDVFNGLLLAPHLDAAFDGGFITVDDEGGVRVSEKLKAEEARVLGLGAPLRLDGLAEGHRGYLAWHREHVFKRSDPR